MTGKPKDQVIAMPTIHAPAKAIEPDYVADTKLIEKIAAHPPKKRPGPPRGLGLTPNEIIDKLVAWNERSDWPPPVEDLAEKLGKSREWVSRVAGRVGGYERCVTIAAERRARN